MEIIVGDIYSTIVNPKHNINGVAIIRQICRAQPDGYKFMPRYRAGNWDGYISLMNGFAQFPTGLLSIVKQKLSDKGIDVVYATQSQFGADTHTVSANDLLGITLRDYQVEAANNLIKAGRGIAKMATNAGKTEVMAAILKSISCKSLVLLHRKELMYQTAKRFQDRGIKDVGIIGDNEFDPDNVTVAMIQTLFNRVGDMDFTGVNLIMVDECHHLSSDTMLDVINRIPAKYRFGFSGTPLKMDRLADLKLIGATGDIVVDISNKFLIDHGYSATPLVRIKAVESTDMNKWKMKYKDAYKRLIVQNGERNNLIAGYARGAKGSILILVNILEHGAELQKLIPEAVFVHGSDTTERRKEVLDMLRAGSGIVISSPIFDEGVDIPSLDCVILAGGGKSQVKLLQRIGRGMRHKDGDNTMKIYDFLDDTNKILLRHSEKRIETYASEGFKTKLIKAVDK